MPPAARSGGHGALVRLTRALARASREQEQRAECSGVRGMRVRECANAAAHLVS
jgi:hypothetical protein